LSQALSYISNNIRSRNTNDLCDVCLRAKRTRMSFLIGENKARNCFDLIHCDIWGPYHIKSFCGAQYFLTIVDNASRGAWICLLKEKSEASRYLKDFCVMAHTQFGAEVKVIRSDNGNEFTSRQMEMFERGIIHQTSCVDTPQ